MGELFHVLEKLRPQVKAEMLRGDEADLFNIANNFTIRHFNEKQKGNYDSPLWHSWMFYVNLSTIHLITRPMNRNARQGASVGSHDHDVPAGSMDNPVIGAEGAPPPPPFFVFLQVAVTAY